MRILAIVYCALALWLGVVAPGVAARSDLAEMRTVTGQLLTAQNGLSPGAQTLSAGVHLVLEPGWKTYWRSPGEVGLPPELDWSGSQNVAEVRLSYPAPSRFTAFEIENFGYGGEVLFPLQVMLEAPDRPTRLVLEMTILVCAEVCIPETLSMDLDVPLQTGVDAEASALIAAWSARVPVAPEDVGIEIAGVGFAGDALVVAAQSEVPFVAPDVFPEHGALGTFGKPEVILSDGGRHLWARLPVLGAGDGPLAVTLVDGARAVTADVAPGAAPARPSDSGLWAMAAIAVLGGLILNVMPCVLPVLSLKLTSALGAAGASPARIRGGFLATTAGVLLFFWVLAVLVVGAKAMGAAVGWGVQFQNPVFLALVIMVIVLFAANLFGLFEVSLPQSWNTAMVAGEGRGGYAGDVATGAFAALLATPCSAPFLGTAVAYALSRGALEIAVIFTALGLGLALPYLALALRPQWIAALPRPGPWMAWVKGAMGLLLLGTALWLLTVLAAVWTVKAAGVVAVVAGLSLLALRLRARALPVAVAALVLAGATPGLFQAAPAKADTGWEVFDRAAIGDRVAAGEVVFVDVTADWCLTCKANKRLVLDRGEVADALAQVTRLRADWTRPDPAIQAYLQDNGRFGIPFNIVYGPAAPEGLALPEILRTEAVLEALAAAGG